MSSFELSTPREAYTVTVASGPSDTFFDGRIRIEPPVTFSEDVWDSVNCDAGATLSHLMTGKEATIIGFGFISEDDDWNHEMRAKNLAEMITKRLSLLESKEQFINMTRGE